MKGKTYGGSIVKVNAGKEENEYRGRVKGEIEQKETKKSEIMREKC